MSRSTLSPQAISWRDVKRGEEYCIVHADYLGEVLAEVGHDDGVLVQVIIRDGILSNKFITLEAGQSQRLRISKVTFYEPKFFAMPTDLSPTDVAR